MIRLHHLLCALLLGPIASAHAGAAKILENKGYHGDEVADVKSGELWTALIVSNGSTVTKHVRISVKTVMDGLIDPEEGPFTGKEISAKEIDAYSDVLFLFKGIDLPPEIETYPLSEHYEKNLIGMEDPITIKGKKGSVSLFAKIGRSAGDGYEATQTYPLFARVNGTEIALPAAVTWSSSGAELLWAGDMNQDGYPDVIINAAAHENSTKPTLFLSSIAPSGITYRMVAQRLSLGC